ncbi:MAG: hypothetical protein CMJ84_14475 [Planctomycetes bacterium]|nr:hypothetical protein [Planctomycetota bacterium]
MPRWLCSLRDAHQPGTTDHALYQDLIGGLSVQVLDAVLTSPSVDFGGYRLTNYMDGWNGVYRYGYTTTGEAFGYGPYELSGTFHLGWWAFLFNAQISSTYAAQAEGFPLASDVIDLYVGPNTTRERHPLIVLPDFYTNGVAQLLTRLASYL